MTGRAGTKSQRRRPQGHPLLHQSSIDDPIPLPGVSSRRESDNNNLRIVIYICTYINYLPVVARRRRTRSTTTSSSGRLSGYAERDAHAAEKESEAELQHAAA